MKISFLGAARTVTGSCFLIETQHSKILVDCGLYQGNGKVEMLNNEKFPFDPLDIDYVLLTHAHIDHSGRIPKLCKDGFKGKIIATKATVELCQIMLPDSGHIQETEAEWVNRKRIRAGKELLEPLYTYQEALDSLVYFKSVRYNELVNLKKYIRVRFNDAGHMLGSSIIELWISDEEKEVKLVFSGDLGNKDIPILRYPSYVDKADYLIIESTYGNREHKDSKNKVEKFVEIINSTIDKGGNVIIPSFAVGRTQEIIYELNKKMEKYSNKILKLFNVPVYIDSPLAISATEIFRNNLDCYDEEARSYIEKGDNPIDFPGLKFTRTNEESKKLNEKDESCIIISASGMCEAGRIKHHLKHNLWRNDSSVIFVGYQANGTLGRKIVDGAKKVRIFGEEISINARIEMIEGFSGHADKNSLLEWIGKFSIKPKRTFIVHGEIDEMEAFSKSIQDQYKIKTTIPKLGSVYNLDEFNGIEKSVITNSARSYKRLQVLEQIENLKEELNEISQIITLDLKNGKDDMEVEFIKNKLKDLEKMMIEVLKY